MLKRVCCTAEAYNWCVVPESGELGLFLDDSKPVLFRLSAFHLLFVERQLRIENDALSTGQDAILFASVAVCVACLAQGRFSNSLILLVGEA